MFNTEKPYLFFSKTNFFIVIITAVIFFGVGSIVTQIHSNESKFTTSAGFGKVETGCTSVFLAAAGPDKYPNVSVIVMKLDPLTTNKHRAFTMFNNLEMLGLKPKISSSRLDDWRVTIDSVRINYDFM